MSKLIFVLSVFWLFVFIFRKKTHKFFFLATIDSLIFIILFFLKIKYIFLIILLMFMVNFFVLLIPEQDMVFEKKDIFFVISVILIMPLIIFVKDSKNVFLIKLTIVEQLQIVLLFFLFAAACFFVLKQIISINSGQK